MAAEIEEPKICEDPLEKLAEDSLKQLVDDLTSSKTDDEDTTAMDVDSPAKPLEEEPTLEQALQATMEEDPLGDTEDPLQKLIDDVPLPLAEPAKLDEPQIKTIEETMKEMEEGPTQVEVVKKPVEDPIKTLSAENKKDVIMESAKEIESQDILVCGKCHHVFYFMDIFQEHKSAKKCKGTGELKETLSGEKKPQIWAFTLWKNTKFKDEEGKPTTTSGSLYQLWQKLEDREKDVWIKAGENVQGLFEISSRFDKLKSDRKAVKKEMLEEDDKPLKEKDPLELEGDIELKIEKKKILKPVQANNKVTLITRKKVSTNKRAARTGSDPNTEYVVEEILSKRYNPRKRTFEYLVKWENFDTSEPCTWEPAAGLQNCKAIVEEFDKNLQIQREQQRIQKILAKKKQPKKPEVILTEGRPQRTSKQKALNQVKQWCGNMDSDENYGKRIFSDDSEDDDSFEKRLKYEEYSSDSENDTPVVTIKRISKSQNGVGTEKSTTTIAKKIETVTLPDNILIPDAKGIVRINQKQIPSLSSGVYVMSKTAGIIKLDTKASKLATSGGQTVLKVAPKIGQTSIKVIKKDMSNGTTAVTTSRTANILRAKPVIRNYSSKVYMQKKVNTQLAKKSIMEATKDDGKDDDESDGVEELEFPTDIPLPAPDSPPPDFTLCPLTGKVLGKDGKPLEPEPEPEPAKVQSTNDNTAALDNLVNMAAADILEDLQDESTSTAAAKTEGIIKMQVEEEVKKTPATPIKDTKLVTSRITVTKSTPEPKTTDSILSTALTNANIPLRRVSGPPPPGQRATKIISRTTTTTPTSRPTPQAIITRITPGTSVVQRNRVPPPKPKETTIIRKRVINSTPTQNRSVMRRVGETTKVYTPQSTVQQVTYVTTPTTGNSVINMPALIESEPAVIQPSETKSQTQQKKKQVEDETPSVPTTSAQSAVSLNSLALGDPETPLLITGEDGTIYQVAGQNEDGQTILITQGEDGEQQCLLVAPENAGLINQALMKPEVSTEMETAEQPVVQMSAPVEEPITINTEPEEAADDSQVVAQIVSANPPSPGGTRKVVLLLPDGNYMMTEVTAEQYAALELDK